MPQVQLIGNGTLTEHDGLATAVLKHPSHITFHKTRVSEDEAKGYTVSADGISMQRYTSMIPFGVTTLYGITVPKGDRQTVRYDDGTGDELSVSLAPTVSRAGPCLRFCSQSSRVWR